MKLKKITMEDIAAELGISKSLVSKALSGSHGISEDTKDKVRAAAIRLGYRFKKGVPQEATDKTGNVAVLLPREDVGDFDYWGVILKSIEVEMSRNGYSVMFSGIDTQAEKGASLPLSITEHKVDGVIILGRIPRPIILSVIAAGLPIVLIDSDYHDLNVDLVYADNYGGGFEAARHMIKNGHRNLGFIGNLDYSWTFRERYRGFAAAVDQYRSETGDEIKLSVFSGDVDFNHVPVSYGEIMKCLEADQRPDALFCANDPIAFVVMQAMDQLGIACPDEMSIMGFDNVSKCEMSVTPLTSIEPHKSLMGERASQMLLRRMEYDNGVSEKQQLVVKIVERKTINKVE